MVIREHVPLAPLVTFRAGGSARYLIEIREPDDVFRAAAFARERGLPCYVLGGGSNTLPQDGEWNGVILHMKISGVTETIDGEATILEEGAGVVWDDLVAYAVAHDLHGLENLSWIPGTVGAAPVQNIGAYGVEVASLVEYVTVADLRGGIVRTLARDACGFRYRSSIFKHDERGRYVVLRVAFRLSRASASANIGYGDATGQYRGLAEYFKGRAPEEVTPRAVRLALREVRGAKFAPLSGEGTAGSFFENPVVPRAHATELRDRFPKLPLYDTADPEKVKLPAGFLIEHVAGYKGVRDGNVGTSPLHALAIQNYGGATAGEIDAFADRVRDAVFVKTGITLAREVVSIK